MTEWLKAIPFAHQLYLKIAEPRTIRILHFILYASMLGAGGGIIMDPPSSFQGVLGSVLVTIFGLFVFMGALMSAIAVLPGIWWLERAGIIALTTGMGMYTVIITTLGSSTVAISVAFAFVVTFVIRWVEISGSQLAPVEPREE